VPSHDGVFAQLQSRLDVLTRRVGAITRDLRRPGDPDWKERAVEVENDDVLEGLDDASRIEVAQIRAALARLDAGTYGRCARCGEAIAPARLAAMPSATTCVSCAAVRHPSRNAS
jgi:RNA polymerase-binding transcription factor DksA